MSATCRSCPAEIVWAEFDTSGKRSPFDVEPVEPGPGTWALIRGIAYAPTAAIEKTAEVRGVSTARAAQILNDAGVWHTSHFATCPNADQHRRPA